MSASARAAVIALAAGLAAGALAWGVDWKHGALAELIRAPGSPDVRALALTWERTHCYECEAPAEPSASEARARARPPR